MTFSTNPCAAALLPRKLMLPLICLILGILIATPLSATVDAGEIIPSSVYVIVGTVPDPVNGISVTFYWQTVHPGNSIVIIENDLNYQGTDNSPSRQIIQNDFTTTHVVVVDHFPTYSTYPIWAYYVATVVQSHCPVAKQAVCTQTATYPGPATAFCSSPPAPGCGGTYLTFNLPGENSNGPLVFTMWPVGGQNVYQGDPTQSPACTPTSKSSRECNDLYVVTQSELLSGPSQALVIMENVVITNLDTGQVVTDNSITAQYLCDLDASSNPPPQGWDGDYNSQTEACYNGTLYSANSTVRLRVNSQAVPGHYQFAANFQGQLNGQNAGSFAMTYNFTVLPTASFTPTPPTTFPAIANLSTWQNNMVNFNAPPGSDNADFQCTNVTDTNPWFSLDNGNFSGYFDIPGGYYFEAWNYDGGRVYQQVNDYDQYIINQYKQTDPAEWHRCTQLAMEPYKDTDLGTAGGFVDEPNQFPFGMEMYYLRTGDPTYKAAVDQLAHARAYNLYYSAPVYAESVRVSAYIMDNRLADEMVGYPRNTAFILRGVDVMLGYLDQSYNLNFSNPNQQEYDIHPFMVGLAMEALITYYELDLAEGNTPDARIPLEIKKTLDWWQATQYIPISHTLAYQAYDIPKNPHLVAGTLFDATELNDLVTAAYAWYWSKTGAATYLNAGDDLFAHVWDSGGWTWSVKEYNQIYKGSFDYVRWRSGRNPDGTSPVIETVLPAANPYTGPLTDYSTPVQFTWEANNGNNSAGIDANLSDSTNTVTVTSSTATIFLNVFKPNTTMTVYYGTETPPVCNTNNPQPPYCMQPYPNFGFLPMLQASYSNQSQSVVGVQDPIALSQGITNIYDETVTITGLAPNTTYHWRPLATDALGNMAAYRDETFTTLGQ
jgi:hypothetical protein